MNEALIRSLTPSVLGVLVRRGADFAAAEDAVQDALVEAVRVWPADGVPANPKGWLVTVAWRKFLDAARADTARRRREDLVDDGPTPEPATATDDTLQLYFLCAHPSLTPSSAVALTLRAVGGLTTRQIAAAYLVPEATMAQRVSRAKRTVSGVRFDRPGDVATVLRVLYLVFNEGYSGDVDLAAEAIRLTRQLAAAIDTRHLLYGEVAGLLALMLLHHARRATRTAPDGSLVPLAEQDRGRWDTAAIADGVEILQAALARDRLGEFQAQAAIAALHADAPTAEDTDWVQIVEWYDELARLTDSPVVRLNRAVAVGQADGPRAGLAALAALDDSLPRHTAVAAHLHERDGDLATAARLYAEAAHKAPNLAERDHLTRQAARLNARRVTDGRSRAGMVGVGPTMRSAVNDPAGHRPAKVAPRLAEHLDGMNPPERVEVVIELAGDQPRTAGSRAERIAMARSTFARDLDAVSATITAAGGEIIESAWLNRTILGRLPAGGIASVAADDAVAVVDLPGRLDPDAHPRNSSPSP